MRFNLESFMSVGKSCTPCIRIIFSLCVHIYPVSISSIMMHRAKEIGFLFYTLKHGFIIKIRELSLLSGSQSVTIKLSSSYTNAETTSPVSLACENRFAHVDRPSLDVQNGAKIMKGGTLTWL